PRGTGAAARVEQPRPATTGRDTQQPGRNPKVRMITGVEADQPVVAGGGGIECRRYLAARQAAGYDGHCATSSRSRSRDRSHSTSTAVTSAQPNKKSSTGMSNGKRMP